VWSRQSRRSSENCSSTGSCCATGAANESTGLPGGEGAFLLCTFWLADALALLGRDDDARSILERLLGLRNDVGLLSEEYDPVALRQLGNFPQAFTHLALVDTALILGAERGLHHHPS